MSPSVADPSLDPWWKHKIPLWVFMTLHNLVLATLSNVTCAPFFKLSLLQSTLISYKALNSISYQSSCGLLSSTLNVLSSFLPVSFFGDQLKCFFLREHFLTKY
jgi:hypothetical protein